MRADADTKAKEQANDDAFVRMVEGGGHVNDDAPGWQDLVDALAEVLDRDWPVKRVRPWADSDAVECELCEAASRSAASIEHYPRCPVYVVEHAVPSDE